MVLTCWSGDCRAESIPPGAATPRRGWRSANGTLPGWAMASPLSQLRWKDQFISTSFVYGAFLPDTLLHRNVVSFLAPSHELFDLAGHQASVAALLVLPSLEFVWAF